MTRKFLSQEQMAEAKRSEAIANAIQKREGTNYPTTIIAFDCGCIWSHVRRYDRPVLSPAEADVVLKMRKRTT